LPPLGRNRTGDARQLSGLVNRAPLVASPDEPLRVVVYRMAEAGVTRLPVVDRVDPRCLVGLISLADLLKARVRVLDEERRRERVLRIHALIPLRRAAALASKPGVETRG